MISVTDIEDVIKTVETPWSPVDVAIVNDQVIRLALFEGEYHWHRHMDEDELFYVYKGEISIQIRDHPTITLRGGELAVIPKNVEHKPEAENPSIVLMFEPCKLKSRGN